MQRKICRKRRASLSLHLLFHTSASASILRAILFFHRGVTSHTLRRVTPSHHLPLTLSRTPHKVGVLCPSLPLPQFGKNPAGRGNLSHPFSLSSLCAIFSISLSLSLSVTDKHKHPCLSNSINGLFVAIHEAEIKV